MCIDQRSLKELLTYDPATGAFQWLFGEKVHTAVQGKEAGSVKPDGYRTIVIKGKGYLAHRLAWLYMTGSWPVLDVDHKDRTRDNNVWTNLREATKSQNQQNRGFGGVNWMKGVKRWKISLRFETKQYQLGFHKCFGQAVKARNRAKQNFDVYRRQPPK